jgi:hypothetical protein
MSNVSKNFQGKPKIEFFEAEDFFCTKFWLLKHQQSSLCQRLLRRWEGSNEFLNDSEVSIDSVDVVNKANYKFKLINFQNP